MIGAVVLLGIGIVGFPLVFETQPRPIPVDIAIEIPKRDAVPPLRTPSAPAASSAALAASQAARPAATVAAASTPPQRAVGASAPPRLAASASLARAMPASAPPPRALPASAPPRIAAASSPPRAAAASAAVGDDGQRARALLEGRSSAVPAPAAASGAQRYVVQVGAFSDAGSARETRQKVERLGLKTYTQVAETPGGNRIRVRVGPFASRDEAEAALAKAKAGGLAAVVLTL